MVALSRVWPENLSSLAELAPLLVEPEPPTDDDRDMDWLLDVGVAARAILK